MLHAMEHQRRTRRGLVLACLTLAAGAAGCNDRIFAPSTSIVKIVVTGQPADPGSTVTAHVQDRIPPCNRTTQSVGVGGVAVFRDLGDGFDILAGLDDLDRHACDVASVGGAAVFARSEVEITTTGGGAPTVSTSS